MQWCKLSLSLLIIPPSDIFLPSSMFGAWLMSFSFHSYSHSASPCSVSIFILTSPFPFLYLSPRGTNHIPWIVIGFSHILNVCRACLCVFLMCVLWCKYHWFNLSCTCTTLKPCLSLNVNKHELVINFFHLNLQIAMDQPYLACRWGWGGGVGILKNI